MSIIIFTFILIGPQIFDLTELRGLDENPNREFKHTVHYGMVSNTHNIAANVETNTVFLVGSTRTSNASQITCDGGKILLF